MSARASPPLRVVIADDAPDVRMLLQLVLGDCEPIAIVGVAADGQEAVALAEQEQPDLVVLDLAMPTMDGLEAAARIRMAAPGCRIIVLSATRTDRVADEAKRAGADAFVEKAGGDDELLATIEKLFPGLNASHARGQGEADAGPPLSPVERRYRLLLDALAAMPDVLVIVCDPALNIEIVTGGARSNLASSQLVGRTVTEAMSPQNAELAADAFRSALAGRRVTLEDIRSPIDGSLWRSTHVPVRDEHGAIVAAMAVARDVTEKSDAMAAARTGERRLNAALSSMLDPFVLLAAVRDEEGRIVDFVYEYANPAAGVANKVPAEELIGRRLLEFLPGHGETGMFERYAQLVETGEPLVYDGMEYEDVWGGVRERRVFDVRAVPIGEGLAYTWRDVTRRTALEEELERAREEMARAYARLAAIVDAAPIAIAAVDAEDRVTLWSGGSERVFGWSKDEVLGRALPTVPEDGRDEFEATRERQKAGEALVGVEFTRRHKDGHAIPVAFYSAPVRDSEGRLLETVGILVDVTEQKNAERRLLEALERARRSSESKQALMRALAHDVGNPLTVIRGFAHMLEERSDRLDANQRRMLLTRIRAQADWLLRLTADLLEAERLDDTEVTRVPTDLAQIVAETLAAVDHRGHPVTVDAANAEATVDPVRVRRIIENLIVNAVRHTPAGTRIWVRVERHGDHAVLTVEDAGPGVPVERRQSLFEPFDRGVASGGTGLGLSLVRRFAVDQGGRAWMEDRPGGGASFKVLLPAV